MGSQSFRLGKGILGPRKQHPHILLPQCALKGSCKSIVLSAEQERSRAELEKQGFFFARFLKLLCSQALLLGMAHRMCWHLCWEVQRVERGSLRPGREVMLPFLVTAGES